MAPEHFDELDFESEEGGAHCDPDMWPLTPGHFRLDVEDGTPIPIEQFLISGAVETCLVTPDNDDDEDNRGKDSGTNTIRNSKNLICIGGGGGDYRRRS